MNSDECEELSSQLFRLCCSFRCSCLRLAASIRTQEKSWKRASPTPPITRARFTLPRCPAGHEARASLRRQPELDKLHTWARSMAIMTVVLSSTVFEVSCCSTKFQSFEMSNRYNRTKEDYIPHQRTRRRWSAAALRWPHDTVLCLPVVVSAEHKACRFSALTWTPWKEPRKH